jgi:hypothetical protein
MKTTKIKITTMIRRITSSYNQERKDEDCKYQDHNKKDRHQLQPQQRNDEDHQDQDHDQEDCQ